MRCWVREGRPPYLLRLGEKQIYTSKRTIRRRVLPGYASSTDHGPHRTCTVLCAQVVTRRWRPKTRFPQSSASEQVSLRTYKRDLASLWGSKSGRTQRQTTLEIEKKRSSRTEMRQASCIRGKSGPNAGSGNNYWGFRALSAKVLKSEKKALV